MMATLPPKVRLPLLEDFVQTSTVWDGSDEVVTIHPHICTSGKQQHRNHHCHHKCLSNALGKPLLGRRGSDMAKVEFLLLFIHVYIPDHRDGLCCLYLLLILLSPWKSQRQPSHPLQSPLVGCQKHQRRQNWFCLLWGTDESMFVLGERWTSKKAQKQMKIKGQNNNSESSLPSSYSKLPKYMSMLWLHVSTSWE